MKTLYLVRHAKSSWKYPELSDFDRPLNKRGKKSAPEMGERLRQKQIMPDLIISSPANRALITAHVIAKKIGYPKKEIIEDENIYHAGEYELIDIIRQTDEAVNSLMVFGHNPGFTYLSNLLSDTSIDNIPTAGVVCIQFSTDSWQEIRNKKGELIFFDYPKKIHLF